MKIRLTPIALLFLMMPNLTFAADKLRGDVFCFPAKDVPKLVNKLSEVKQEQRDIVDVKLNSKFLIKDGGDWPERFFLRTESSEIDIPIEKPSGLTPTFLEQANAHPQSCLLYTSPSPRDQRGSRMPSSA